MHHKDLLVTMSVIDTIMDTEPRKYTGIGLQATVREAAEVMLHHNIGELVAVEDGKPVGILTEHDLVRRVLAKGLDTSAANVKSIMSQPLVTIASQATLDHVIEIMARKGVRQLLVQEGDELIGIVTESDMRRVLQKCGNCHKEIPPLIRREQSDRGHVTCSCNTRYHRDCAEQVVHCVYCGATLITEVVYPHPDDTTGA